MMGEIKNKGKLSSRNYTITRNLYKGPQDKSILSFLASSKTRTFTHDFDQLTKSSWFDSVCSYASFINHILSKSNYSINIYLLDCYCT